jgi:hypothetical protein
MRALWHGAGRRSYICFRYLTIVIVLFAAPFAQKGEGRPRHDPGEFLLADNAVHILVVDKTNKNDWIDSIPHIDVIAACPWPKNFFSSRHRIFFGGGKGDAWIGKSVIIEDFALVNDRYTDPPNDSGGASGILERKGMMNAPRWVSIVRRDHKSRVSVKTSIYFDGENIRPFKLSGFLHLIKLGFHDLPLLDRASARYADCKYRNGSGKPDADHPKEINNEIALTVGVFLIFVSCGALIYFANKESNIFYVLSVLGLPFFLIGFGLVFFCFFPYPTPIFGFAVYPFHFG